MTLPSLLLGLVIATMCGALFHLIRGGGIFRLGLDILLAWIGFWIGHFIDEYFGFHFLAVGPLNLGAAVAMSVVVLFLGDWLSRIEIQKN